MSENSDDQITKAIEQLSSLTEAQDARVRRALKNEESLGGGLDIATSTEIRRAHRMRVDQITMLNKTGLNTTTGKPKSTGIVAQILASIVPKARRQQPRRVE